MSISTTPYADILGNLIPFDSRYLLPENRQESHPSQWKESRIPKIPDPRSSIAKHRIVKDRTAKLFKDLGRRDTPRSAPSYDSPVDPTPFDNYNDKLTNKAVAVHEIIKQSHTHRLCVKPGCPIASPHSDDPFNIYAPDCLSTQPPDEILKKRDRVLAFENTFEKTDLYRQSKAYKCTAGYKQYKEEKICLEAVRVQPLWGKDPTPQIYAAQARIEAFEEIYEKSELCRLNMELANTAEWQQYEADRMCLKACWANHGICGSAYSRKPRRTVD